MSWLESILVVFVLVPVVLYIVRSAVMLLLAGVSHVVEHKRRR